MISYLKVAPLTPDALPEPRSPPLSPFCIQDTSRHSHTYAAEIRKSHDVVKRHSRYIFYRTNKVKLIARITRSTLGHRS